MNYAKKCTKKGCGSKLFSNNKGSPWYKCLKCGTVFKATKSK